MSTELCPQCHQPRIPADAPVCPECGHDFAPVTSLPDAGLPPFVTGAVRVAGPIAAPTERGPSSSPAATIAPAEIGQQIVPGAVPTPRATNPATTPTMRAGPPIAAQAPRVAGPQQKPGAVGGMPPKASVIQTTPARAVGVTVGVSALAALVVFVLWIVLTHPDPNADHAFFTLITNSHSFSPLPADDAVAQGYATFMFVLISVTPLAAVGAYWFSLRRLYQEWRKLRLWLKTFALTCALFLLAFVAIGAETHVAVAGASDGGYVAANALWALTMLIYYPALLALALLAALVCTFVGIQFGRWFARWPLDRIRGLQSDPWQDAAMVGGIALVGLIVQFFLYQRLDSTPYSYITPFTLWIWWLPLAAIGIAGYACWHALRPLKPPSTR